MAHCRSLFRTGLDLRLKTGCAWSPAGACGRNGRRRLILHCGINTPPLETCHKVQRSLPAHLGSCGVCSAVELAPAACLATRVQQRARLRQFAIAFRRPLLFAMQVQTAAGAAETLRPRGVLLTDGPSRLPSPRRPSGPTALPLCLRCGAQVSCSKWDGLIITLAWSAGAPLTGGCRQPLCSCACPR